MTTRKKAIINTFEWHLYVCVCVLGMGIILVWSNTRKSLCRHENHQKCYLLSSNTYIIKKVEYTNVGLRTISSFRHYAHIFLSSQYPQTRIHSSICDTHVSDVIIPPDISHMNNTNMYNMYVTYLYLYIHMVCVCGMCINF